MSKPQNLPPSDRHYVDLKRGLIIKGASLARAIHNADTSYAHASGGGTEAEARAQFEQATGRPAPPTTTVLPEWAGGPATGVPAPNAEDRKAGPAAAGPVTVLIQHGDQRRVYADLTEDQVTGLGVLGLLP